MLVLGTARTSRPKTSGVLLPLTLPPFPRCNRIIILPDPLARLLGFGLRIGIILLLRRILRMMPSVAVGDQGESDIQLGVRRA